MRDKNVGAAADLNKPWSSSLPAIQAIVKGAGQLLQKCKAELLQTLAVEAKNIALRHGAAQNTTDFASRANTYVSDAAGKITTAEMSRDNTLSIARHINQARLDIAANRVKARTALVNEWEPGRKVRANKT
ncbi:MAG: hypothetical protein ACT4O2_13785 [Beijerinckiaceae bacterium]